MPALQARRLRHALVLQVRIAQSKKNSSVEERATGFTKTAKWHDCDNAAFLLWPMLWWSTASKSGHDMLE